MSKLKCNMSKYQQNINVKYQIKKCANVWLMSLIWRIFFEKLCQSARKSYHQCASIDWASVSIIYRCSVFFNLIQLLAANFLILQNKNSTFAARQANTWAQAAWDDNKSVPWKDLFLNNNLINSSAAITTN